MKADEIRVPPTEEALRDQGGVKGRRHNEGTPTYVT